MLFDKLVDAVNDNCRFSNKIKMADKTNYDIMGVNVLSREHWQKVIDFVSDNMVFIYNINQFDGTQNG